MLRLRAATLSGPERARVGSAMAAAPLVSVMVVVLAASVAGRLAPGTRSDLLLLLPTAFLAFAVSAVVAAIVSAGGREVLPRSHVVAYPLSPAADFLGAVLLAPLNLAWLLQAAALVGLVSAAVGWTPALLPALVTTLTWLVTATLAAHTLAWGVELVRTLPGGVAALRATGVVVTATLLALSTTGRLLPLLDSSPTVRVVVQALQGSGSTWPAWLLGLGELAVVCVVSGGAGVHLAKACARRPRRDQGRVEAGSYPRRQDARRDVMAALRLDRAGVWRSSPQRRGLLVLALVPGVSAAIARLPWEALPLLPGLVASGAALLFGVNAFALDSGGALWRESLPALPRTWLLARGLVLAEVVLAASLLALAVAAARAPSLPSASEAAAVAVAVVVVCAQVLARCLSWSLHHPYQADLRTARDAPAPPATMAWYSARLALATTATGLLLTFAARADSPVWAMAVGLPLLLLALRRLVACGRLWDRPEVRSRVLTTVAGG